MTSILDTILSMFNTSAAETKAVIADQKPKSPMNVGEVMDVWRYLLIMEGGIVLEQVGKNTTIDADLTELIDEALSLCRVQSDRIKKVMEQEGIPLPPLSGDKPRSEPGAVPLGVKLTECEISNIIAANVVAAALECTRNMCEAVRLDLELMWGHFLFELVKYGAKLKHTMRQRGWLKIPPAYHPPGLPNS